MSLDEQGVATTSSSGRDGRELVTLILKNPSQADEGHFETRVSRNMSLEGLKRRIGEAYPGNPAPESITLVYGGKVLQDEGIVLSSILPSDSPSVAMHMVVKGSSKGDSSRRAAPTNTGAGCAAAPATMEPQDSQQSDDRVSEAAEQAVPSTSGGMGVDLSSEVFRAAYQAALRAIMSEGSSSARFSMGAQQQPGMAFLAPVIPVPEHMFPRTLHDATNESSEDRAQRNQYVMPLIPLGYTAPREAHAGNMLARRRRRREAVHRDRVAAVFDALRDGNAVARQRNAEPRRGEDPPRRRQVQIRIHINMRVLLQMAVLFFVVYQHCPPSRVFGLVSVALLFYLSSTLVGRRLLQRLYGYFNLHRAEQGRNPVQEPAVEDNDNNPQNDADAAAERIPGPREEAAVQQPGMLEEIQAFVAGFLTSLLPAADNRQHNNNPAVVQDVFRGQQ